MGCRFEGINKLRSNMNRMEMKSTINPTKGRGIHREVIFKRTEIYTSTCKRSKYIVHSIHLRNKTTSKILLETISKN